MQSHEWDNHKLADELDTERKADAFEAFKAGVEWTSGPSFTDEEIRAAFEMWWAA